MQICEEIGDANMGTLLEGFKENTEVGNQSILSKYFEEERPTVELLDAIFQLLIVADGDDTLKMAYVLMVTQFFGINEGWTSVPV